MKKILKSALSLTLSLTICITTGFVAYADQSSFEELISLSYEEYIEQLNDSSSGRANELSLHSEKKKDEMINIENLTKGKKSINYDDSIKNNKIDVSSSEARNNGVSLMTDPIAELDVVALNPETLKNGQPTTDTLVAWFYADIDLDGDTIVNRQIGGFPGAYFLGEFSDGSGFVTQFTDPDSYLLMYRVIDSRGEVSDIISYSLEVLPVEDFQLFEGNFTSSNDIKTFDVTVDSAEINDLAIATVRTGKTGIKLNVTDEDGVDIANLGIVSGVNWKYLGQPTSGTTTYTFTVSPGVYDDEFNSYRIVVGNKADIEAMVSGRENAIMLESNQSFISRFTPNKDERWFRIKAEHYPNVITVLNHNPQIRFKILDIDDLYVMFDTNDRDNSDTHKTNYIAGFKGAEKARLGMTLGQEYYLVIYSPTQISNSPGLLENMFNAKVGMPNMSSGSSKPYYYGKTVTGTPSTYSPVVTIPVGKDMPLTAQVWKVHLTSREDVSLWSQMKEWKVKGQSESAWKEMRVNIPQIEYNYVEGSSSNVRVPGNWSVAFKGSLGPLSIDPGLYFYYKYELGD